MPPAAERQSLHCWMARGVPTMSLKAEIQTRRAELRLPGTQVAMRVRGVGLGLTNSLEERPTDQFHSLPPPLHCQGTSKQDWGSSLLAGTLQQPSPCLTPSSVRQMIPGFQPPSPHPQPRVGVELGEVHFSPAPNGYNYKIKFYNLYYGSKSPWFAVSSCCQAPWHS